MYRIWLVHGHGKANGMSPKSTYQVAIYLERLERDARVRFIEEHEPMMVIGTVDALDFTERFLRIFSAFESANEDGEDV